MTRPAPPAPTQGDGALDELWNAIAEARRTQVPLSTLLGAFQPYAARRNIDAATLGAGERQLLLKLLEGAAARGTRSLRVEMATIADWLEMQEEEAGAIVGNVIRARWLWRVRRKRRDGTLLADIYHLTFDLMPGRSAPPLSDESVDAGEGANASTNANAGAGRDTAVRPQAASSTGCPVLEAFARPMGLRAPSGTRATAAVEHGRALRLIDWALRVSMPEALAARGSREHAQRLRERLPAIVDRRMARAVVEVAAGLIETSAVKAAARQYMRASVKGAPGYSARVEDTSAAAFAGWLGRECVRTLGRQGFRARQAAARVLLEIASEVWSVEPMASQAAS